MEIKSLRRICGVTIRDRIRNEEIRRRLGVLSILAGRVEKYVLRWFERMDGEGMTKKIYNSGVGRTRGRGRPNMVWMDGVKTVLSQRRWALEPERVTVHERPV